MLNRKRKLRIESLEGRVLAANLATTDLSNLSSGLNAPIEMIDVEGLRAAEIKIEYDPAVFATDNRSINAGSVWKGRGMVVANVDEVAGKITAFIFSSEPVSKLSGDLVDIEFRKISNATDDVTIPWERPSIDIQKISLNEQEVVLHSDAKQEEFRPRVRVANIGVVRDEAMDLASDHHASDQTCFPETMSRPQYIPTTVSNSEAAYGPRHP